MYATTRFRELLEGLPRGQFNRIVSRLGGDKYSKKFSSWDHLVTMLYGQLSGAKSLRELEVGFNQQSVHHYHLGTGLVKRSTLSDANATRRSDVFRELSEVLLSGVHRAVRKESRELLYLLDSTPIPLKGFGYDEWSRATRSPQTQGLKVHLQIESKDAMPVYLDVTTPRINDLLVGRDIALESGATYVFDKGYYDYNWWYRFHEEGAFFVTPLKKNAGVEVESINTIPEECQGDILEDAIIQFKHKHPGGHRINHHYGTALRRVTINRPRKQKPLVLVTNDFSRSAEALSDLYRRRWEIETFFKWLKQNLKIKKFLGRSENAVRTQIYIALITYILLQLYQKRMGLKSSLKLIAVGLKTSLFQRIKTEQKVYIRHRLRRKEISLFQSELAL